MRRFNPKTKGQKRTIQKNQRRKLSRRTVTARPVIYEDEECRWRTSKGSQPLDELSLDRIKDLVHHVENARVGIPASAHHALIEALKEAQGFADDELCRRQAARARLQSF